MTPRWNQAPRRSHRTFGAAAVALLLAGEAPAQKERDTSSKDAMVFRAFPEATSYRLIVRDVDQDARTTIERELPFKVHFDELGPHTLFVAFRGDRQPVGLLYLRSEESEWGLTEIAWAVTLEMRVVGFQFQRGRSRHQRELEGSAFARNLAGRNFDQLRQMLKDGEGQDASLVPDGAGELATTVLRSGSKALLVIDTVWKTEIVKLQDLGMGFDAFPTADRFRRTIVRFDVGTETSTQRVVANVVRATGKGNLQLGAVLRTEADVGGVALELRWIVDQELRIVRIVPVQSWPGDDLRLCCKELEGVVLGAPLKGPNALQTLACGLGETLRRMDAPKGSR